MTIVVSLPSAEKTGWWVDQLRALMPGWTIRPISDPGPAEEVRYAVVWKPATGCMTPFANLRAIVSLGAGIDHVFGDAELPRGVPIIRTVGTDLTQRMMEYVVLHVLRHHRAMPEIAAARARRDWHQVVVPPATERHVGVMGLGNLGAVAAQALAGLGFRVSGWARSAKEIDGITCHAGPAGFESFLDGTEILVNLLPLTDETRGILGAATFARLPRGASIINAGRGPHLVDADLTAALDAGRLSHATLDVFHVEPLPQDHPFWTDARITITPHIASMIDAPTGSRIVAANITRFEAEGTVPDIADATRGY